MKRSAILASFLVCLGSSAAYGEDAAPTIEMVRVPGGCFQMGTVGYEKHEQPIHKVCVDSFDIGKLKSPRPNGVR